MCLGESVRQANKNAIRRTRYADNVRIRKDYQNISVYGAKKVKHAVDSDRIRRAVTDRRALNSIKRRQAREMYEEKNMQLWTELLENSKVAKLIGSGRTGKSIKRLEQRERAKMLRQVAQMGNAIRKNDMALKLDDEMALQQGKGALENSRATVMFTPQAGIPAPRPVLQNVGWGAFKDGLSIAGSIAGVGTGFGGADFWDKLF